MPPVHVLIKPASSACNMQCSYCFYRDVSSHREESFSGMLSTQRMEQIVKAALEYAEGSCTFAFQGGEPTLAGLDFYRNVVELVKNHQKPGVKVFYAIQTNGYALDEEWAKFFAKHHFLVGLSLDGPAELHDSNRKDHSGSGTFNRVMKTAQLFDKYKVEYNVLSVVTGRNARAVQKTYQFFKKHGFRWIQFIPCLEPLDAQRGGSDYALTPKQYGEFLIRIFDLWYQDLQKGQYYSIRHLDNYLSVLLGGRPEACSMTGRCAIQFVVEGDGGVYPCDFYVLDQWRLGTVGAQSFAQMAGSETASAFLRVSHTVPEQCKACPYYVLCRNGCRRDRMETEQGADLNYYCEAYRLFFSQRLPQLREAANRLVKASRS